MAVYVKRGTHWVLSTDESVVLDEDEIGLLATEHQSSPYKTYVKTQNGADLLDWFNKTPLFLLNENDEVILKDNDTGILLHYGGGLIKHYDATAIYSEDDNSLVFYYIDEDELPEIGNIYNDKIVTNIYTGFETHIYTDYIQTPWYDNISNIKIILTDSSFNKVTPVSTAFWFAYMSNCESIDLTYLDTSNVTQMQQMFRSCTSLTSLDLSMFNMNKVERIANMFRFNTNLKTIDICGWETGSILYMANVFQNCTSLTTIYADRDFEISSDLQNDAQMFTGCTSLVGGNGTKYDSSKVTSSMAKIDKEGTEGYFTQKQ